MLYEQNLSLFDEEYVMLNVDNASVYTDFNGLAKLKNEAKNKTADSIKEVAKQFESVFVGMMLKSMRQAKLADGIFDSSQSDFYRDMYDQQLSVHLAGERGIGLAEMIEKQLSPKPSVAVDREQKIADYERQLLIRAPQKKSTNKAELVDGINKEIASLPIASKVDSGISSVTKFVNKLRPYAQQAAKKLGVDANLLLAQAALETGWGKSVIKSAKGNSSHNLFNIKADKSWLGNKTKVSTLEFHDGVAKKEMAGFRSYGSYQESFDDYVNFIKTNPRYKVALQMTQKPERYMHELQQAGYATDPHYADKVMKIYQSNVIANSGENSIAMKQDLTSDNS